MAGVVPLKGLNWSPGMVDEILTSLLAKECQTCFMLFTLRALKICDGGGDGSEGGGTTLVACKSVMQDNIGGL